VSQARTWIGIMILVTAATGHVGRAVTLCASIAEGRYTQSPVASLPLRAETQRACEISFFEQRPGVRIASPAHRSLSE
jgi:hypothetical protein